MKNRNETSMPSTKLIDINAKETRVFARRLSHPLTALETNQVSGGSSSDARKNGRWFWTDTKKIKGYDWEPN